MFPKHVVSTALLSCLLKEGFALQQSVPVSAPKAAPTGSSSFVEELQSQLRPRNLQGGTQDVGEACLNCSTGPKCKDGLECKMTGGVCLCGFSCNPGTCQVAPTPAPVTPPAPAPPIACFAASATVQTADRGTVTMKNLAVGDQVLTPANAYEEVYAFGHRNPTTKTTFLQIHTAQHPTKPIEMTDGHMLRVNGGFLKAGSVRVGDTLQGEHGLPTKVTKIRSVSRQDGVYAPLTPSGMLVVDHIVASAYVSLQKKENEYPVLANGHQVPISQQLGIHMALSPYRMLCMGVSLDTLCHSKTKEGISTYVDLGIRLGKYADTLGLGMQLVLLVVAVALFVPIFVIESVVGAQYAPLVVFLAVLGWWKVQRLEAFAKKKSV